MQLQIIQKFQWLNSIRLSFMKSTCLEMRVRMAVGGGHLEDGTTGLTGELHPGY